MFPFLLIPYHPITNGIFTAISLTQFITPGFQQRITRQKQAKTQLEETEEASEPGSDMAGMLEREITI